MDWLMVVALVVGSMSSMGIMMDWVVSVMMGHNVMGIVVWNDVGGGVVVSLMSLRPGSVWNMGFLIDSPGSLEVALWVLLVVDGMLMVV